MGSLEAAPLVPEQSAWREVLMSANAWRGACLHHFTAVELAVTESLLWFDQAKPGKVRLRHLIGQRFEDLAIALADDGAFSHPTAAKALDRFRTRHEAFRTLLCHGHITVTMEINGRWLLVVQTVSIRSRQGAKSIEVIRQPEAEERLLQLKQDGQVVMAALGNARKDAGAN